jgi:exodeoxyribonuclease VII small subunit
MPTKKDEKSYVELLEELKEILHWFQNSEVSVDKASEKYQQGLALLALLEKRLSVAETEITVLAKQTVS